MGAINDFSLIDFALRQAGCGVGYKDQADFLINECGDEPFPWQIIIQKFIFLEDLNEYETDVINKLIDYDKSYLQKDVLEYAKEAQWGLTADAWDRYWYLKKTGAKHFKNVIFSGGRRGSKGYTCAGISKRHVNELSQYGDVFGHYGIRSSKPIRSCVVANSLTQAKANLFKDLQEGIENSPLKDRISKTNSMEIQLYSDDDIMYNMTLPKKIRESRARSTFQVMPISSNSSTNRGFNIFSLYFDEIAFSLNGESMRAIDQIYSALQPSTRTFGSDSIIVMASSPWTEVGLFFEKYTNGRILKGQKGYDPYTIVLNFPSWALYTDWERSEELYGIKKTAPMRYIPVHHENPETEREREEEEEYQELMNNPDKYKVETMAIFAKVQDQYLPSKDVEDIFLPVPSHNLVEKTGAERNQKYFIHCDPALSNDNFSIAVCHGEKINGEVHSFIDKVVVFRPKDFPEHKIDYNLVEKCVEGLIKSFIPELVTYDQWNSAASIQNLDRFVRENGYPTRVELSSSNNGEMPLEKAEEFKIAVLSKRLHSYKDTLLDGGMSRIEAELKMLQLKNGKIFKLRIGHDLGHLDAADAIVEACYQSLTNPYDTDLGYGVPFDEREDDFTIDDFGYGA